VLIKQEDGTSLAAPYQQQQQRGLSAQHANVQQQVRERQCIVHLVGAANVVLGPVQCKRVMGQLYHTATGCSGLFISLPRPLLYLLLTLQVIKVSVVTTADDLPPQPAATQPQHQPPPQQQQQQQHARAAAALKPRQLVHRLPDAAAAARFTSDELPYDESAAAAGAAAVDDEYMDVDTAAAESSTEQRQQQLLAPRMVGDPGQVAQQLAGWVRVNVAGEGGEAEGVPGQHDDEFEEEGLLGQGAAEADDMLDEEEWV
jgi:hypothetical protein